VPRALGLERRPGQWPALALAPELEPVPESERALAPGPVLASRVVPSEEKPEAAALMEQVREPEWGLCLGYA
jgi:hypothetical protein